MNGEGSLRCHNLDTNYSVVQSYEGHFEIGNPAGFGKVFLKNNLECEGQIQTGVCEGIVSDRFGSRKGKLILKFPYDKHTLKNGKVKFCK